MAESEWGRSKDRRLSPQAVMEDIAKIIAARCPLKVMVFSHFVKTSRSKVDATFGGLTRLMRQLIEASEDSASYVLFGMPWNGAGLEVEVVRGS